jgi:dTDP-L-rhamnose 4-epimerase
MGGKMEKVLITGGAGFIGRFVTGELLRRCHQVRVLDALIPQVHGETASRPNALNKDAEFIHGDVRDADAVARALKGVGHRRPVREAD